MLSGLFLLSLFLSQADSIEGSSEGSSEGSIEGVVLNGSANRAPLAGADVVLRAQLDDELAPVAETTTDDAGRFLFEQLPLDQDIIYLPGANRGGVHYPGQRVRLTPHRSDVYAELIVHDAVAHPCPLTMERYEIEIRPEPGVLRVREVLVIANPTSTTYVGQAVHEHAGNDSEPVTLRLAIPSEFERVTFDKEFFGRRFSVEDTKLVTHIPWTPGRRELAFTYLLSTKKAHRIIRRELDLPCSRLRVRVLTDRPQEVSCNLTADTAQQGEEVTFQAAGETLPAGYTIHVELGRLPVLWTAYGRPLAAAALVALIAAASLIMKQRERGQAQGGS